MFEWESVLFFNDQMNLPEVKFDLDRDFFEEIYNFPIIFG